MARKQEMAKSHRQLSGKPPRGNGNRIAGQHVHKQPTREAVQNAPVFGSRSVFVKPPIRDIGPIESQIISKKDIWFNYSDKKDILNLFLLAQKITETSIDIDTETTVDRIIGFIEHGLFSENGGDYDDHLDDGRFENTFFTRFITYDTDEEKVVVKEGFEVDGEWFYLNNAPYTSSRKQKNKTEKLISELFSAYLAKMDFFHLYFMKEDSFITLDQDDIDEIDLENYCNIDAETLKGIIGRIKVFFKSEEYKKGSRYFGTLIKKGYHDILNEMIRLIGMLKDSKKKNDYQRFIEMLLKFHSEYHLGNQRFLTVTQSYGLSAFCNFFISDDNEIGWDIMQYHEFLVKIDMENSMQDQLSLTKCIYGSNYDEVEIFIHFADMISLFNQIQLHDYRKKNDSL